MYKYFFHNKFTLIILVMLRILGNGTLLFFNFILRDITNKASVSMSLDEIRIYSIVLISYVVIFSIITLLVNLLNTRYINTSITLLKTDYFANLINKTYEFISQKDSSYYISTLTNDIGILSGNFFNSIMSIINSTILAMGSFISIIIVDWKIGLIMLALVSLFFITPLVLKKKVDNATINISRANEDYVEELKDNLIGIKTIKVYSSEKITTSRLEYCNKKVYMTGIKSADIHIFASSIVGFLLNLFKIILLLVAVYFVAMRNLDLGSIIAVVTLSASFYMPINSIGNYVTNIIGSRQVRKKFYEVLLIQDKENYSSDFSNYEINLLNITFKYGDKVVLNNINLTFEQGKKYLVLGESGVGKSTLIKLIANLYSSYEGTILIGGCDYRKIEKAKLSKAIAYAQQEKYLFNRSLRDNIDINLQGDVKKITDCVEQCKLTKYVSTLKNGLETIVNEEVSTVSEGEKLRICLARALYLDAPILLLDEVTASLDAATTKEIEEIILSQKNKTIINISHKFSKSSLQNYDAVIIIENGKIVLNDSYSNAKNNKVLNSYLLEE